MSKILILANGTRGDVQPALALGVGLQAAGHDVRLWASPNFAEWIEGYGLKTAVSQVDVQAVMESAGGLAWIESGHKPLVQLRVMRQLIAEAGWTMILDAWHAAQDAELLISSFTSDTFAYSIAEARGIPLISLALQPTMIATQNGRSLVNAPLPNRISRINALFARWLVEPAPWQIYGKLTNRFRRQVLALPPVNARIVTQRRRETPTLMAYSRHVVPQPADWPAHFVTTGYLFLDEETAVWQPPAALTTFLNAGPPPVGLGFGSMTGRDPGRITHLLLEAIQQSGQRAVLLSGWAGLGEAALPETVFRLAAAPHGWLYPRLAAVVHHGGAGTTAAGLRAGVPSVVVPHMVDQPFWGQRVAELGVGPRPIPRHRLTAVKLATAIQTAVTDPAIKARAGAVGEQIGLEAGVETAVWQIQRWLADWF